MSWQIKDLDIKPSQANLGLKLEQLDVKAILKLKTAKLLRKWDNIEL